MTLFLWNRLQNSLLLRMGGVIVAITVLGLVGMSTSWMIAETTQGSGAAINVAGSLRMQNWRMAYIYQRSLQDNTPALQHELQEAIVRFEGDLAGSSVLSVIPRDAVSPLRITYQQVEDRWKNVIKPGLNRQLSNDSEVLRQIPLFVDNINELVKQVEEATEAKILVLRVILAVAIISTLSVVLLSVYLINSILVTPLKSLLALTERIRQGNLSERSDLTGEDEIGQLGRTFNRMAEELDKLYQNLEAQVERKTAELTRSNLSLDLLYRSITRLHGVFPDREVFQDILKDAEEVIGLGQSSICLKSDSASHGRIIATTTPEEKSLLCQHATDCTECHKLDDERLNILPDGRRVLRMPLNNMEECYGILVVEIPHNTTAERWQIQMLDALSRHIGVTIASEQRIEQRRLLSLLEERAVIARELHDSLAQSLAYMKIQVSRLRSAINKTASQQKDDQEVNEALEELRDGLSNAYQQLRELLSTFRLRMAGADLKMALGQTATEFAERSNLPINVDIELGNIKLTPNEEIHILQIVREALSNIIKHAQATQAQVSLHNLPGQKLCLRVIDDGIGIQKSANMHHYGMAIMEERARAMNGIVLYFPNSPRGTCVQLEFTPSNLQFAAKKP